MQLSSSNMLILLPLLVWSVEQLGKPAIRTLGTAAIVKSHTKDQNWLEFINHPNLWQWKDHVPSEWLGSSAALEVGQAAQK